MINSQAIDQLLNYQSLVDSRFMGWSNGLQTAVYDLQAMTWVAAWATLVEEISKK